ncbi:PAS domain S-box-containing protein [Mariprofundus ferrinatatus]|uniref:histidine kinase n=1 Tax=Mariprofundus ferrinatatus TaxID=1921087 RepID=A0A2K8L1G1_9PROT|nr:PAS domain S-box protein [Mariprofundus ferrinatatus]ATX81083.1 PAS domain S-box-containing protein [Mariprofundus ferrinatatus]
MVDLTGGNDIPFKILIVDDNPNNLFTLESLLRRLDDCEIVQASSGEAALATTIENSIDLILLDVQMPGMDGYSTAEHLKMTRRTRDIPIIFITAVFKSAEFIKHGYEVGAIDYLTKPLDENQLLNRIRLYRKIFERETALRKALKTLEFESQERFRSYFERSTVGMAIVNPDRSWQEVNDALCLMLGYSRDELMHMPWSGLVCPDDQNLDEDSINALLSGETDGYTIELRFIHKGGQVVHTHFAVRSVCKEQGGIDYLTAMIVDISKAKEAEAVLRRLSQAVEQAGESIFITDCSGIIEYVNPAFSELTGYSSDEVVGQKPKVLKSGKQQAIFYEKMWNTILSGQVWHGKMIDRKKDGSFYPAMVTISPIKNQLSETTGFVCLQQDLSENEELENRFYQAQKMEALGTLVGGIAHEFNNSLAGITGNLYLAKKLASQLPEVIEKLDIIEKLSFKSAELIKNLLSFARKGVIQKTPINLPLFLKEVIKVHRVSLPEHIRLDLDVGAVPMTVKWDANLLQQALINLINNACDALMTVEGPLISIKLSEFSADDDFLARHPEVDADNFACLAIRDNGTGISPDDLPHILEPFYTTKKIGKGTGLGLSMVSGAMHAHQACMEVESVEGEGALFLLYLPLQEAEEIELSPRQCEVSERGVGELILLVDDEKNILETSKEVLESIGYRVLVASDGSEAVDVFKANKDEVSIVVTDIMMPKLGGVEAVGLMKKIRPEIKVVFTTGYNKEEERLGDIHSSDAIVLYKPYDVDELGRTIRRALDA